MDWLTTRAWHEVRPPLPAEQRTRLRHTVAHGEGQPNLLEALFHFGLEGGTAHNKTAHTATERRQYLLAYNRVKQLVRMGYFVHPFHLLERRLDGVGIDLLHDQRLLHGFQQRRGRGRLAKEPYRYAVDVRMDELDGQSIHVGHGEHRDDGLAGLVREVRVTELVGVRECAVGEHYSLGVTRRSRSVVDDGELVPVVC